VRSRIRDRKRWRDEARIDEKGAHGQSRQENVSLPLSEPVVVHPHEGTVWLHDAETLALIKKMQQQKGAAQ